MPACVSSLIPSSVGQPQPDGLPVVDGQGAEGLLVALERVVDPRARRGVRHRLASVLAIGACAVLAGARSFAAIAEWAHEMPPASRTSLGVGRRPPSETAIRRTLQRVEPEALDRVISRWLASRRGEQPSPRWSAIAIDGKSVRGARTGDGRALHLLAALDHAGGTVLAQTRVDGKSNEITAFAPLLEAIDLAGVIVTADAMHTQRGHAQYLAGRGAHYLLTVKNNQPSLHARLADLPWADIPVADTLADKAHGRVESRRVQLTTISTGIGFPHAGTVARITRIRRPLASRRRQTETVYVITDLDQAEIRADELADLARSHWHIENKLHWVRDVTFAEDASQIRTGHGPHVMASLRNLAIGIHRHAGASNIAAACRHVARHPNRVLTLIT